MIDLTRAVTDPGWLNHWRGIWERKLGRKKRHDDETVLLTIAIALVDSALDRLEIPND